jgi:hypothetical protein
MYIKEVVMFFGVAEKSLVDTSYHVIAGIISTLVVAYLLSRLHVPYSRAEKVWYASWVVVFLLYFREVTQQQSLYYHSDIFSGWFPLGGEFPWGLNKNVETFIPICITLMVAFIYKRIHAVHRHTYARKPRSV